MLFAALVLFLSARPAAAGSQASDAESAHKKLSKLFAFDKANHADLLIGAAGAAAAASSSTTDNLAGVQRQQEGNKAKGPQMWDKVSSSAPAWMQAHANGIHNTMVESKEQLEQDKLETDMVFHESLARNIVREVGREIRDEAALGRKVITDGLWSTRTSTDSATGAEVVARYNAEQDPIGVMLLELFGVDLQHLGTSTTIQMMAFLEHFIRSPLATFELENLVAEDHGKLISSLNKKLEKHLETVASSNSSLLRTKFNSTERASLNDELSSNLERAADNMMRGEHEQGGRQGDRFDQLVSRAEYGSDSDAEASDATRDLLENVKSIADTLSSDDVRKLKESEHALSTHEVHLHSRHTQRVWLENGTNLNSSLSALSALNLSEAERNNVLEGLHRNGSANLEQQDSGAATQETGAHGQLQPGTAGASSSGAGGAASNNKGQTLGGALDDPESMVQIEIEESEDIDLLFLTNQSTAAKAEFNLHTMLGQAQQIVSIPLARYILTPETRQEFYQGAFPSTFGTSTTSRNKAAGAASTASFSTSGASTSTSASFDHQTASKNAGVKMYEWALKRLHLPGHSRILEKLPFNWTDFSVNSTLFMQIRIDNTSDTSIADNLDRETLVHTILDVYRSVSVVDIASTFPATLALAAFADSVISAIEARATQVNAKRMKRPTEDVQEENVYFKNLQHVLEASRINKFIQEVQRIEAIQDPKERSEIKNLYLNPAEIYPPEVKLGFAGLLGTVMHLDRLDVEEKEKEKSRRNCVAEVDERANVLLRGKLSLYRMDHVAGAKQESEMIQASGRQLLNKSSRFLNMWDAITAPYAQEDFYVQGLANPPYGKDQNGNGNGRKIKVLNDLEIYFRDLQRARSYKLHLLGGADLDRLHVLPEGREFQMMPTLKYGHHGGYLANVPAGNFGSRYGSFSKSLFGSLFQTVTGRRSGDGYRNCFEYSNDLCALNSQQNAFEAIARNQIEDDEGTKKFKEHQERVASGQADKQAQHQINCLIRVRTAFMKYIYANCSARGIFLVSGLVASLLFLAAAVRLMLLSGENDFDVTAEKVAASSRNGGAGVVGAAHPQYDQLTSTVARGTAMMRGGSSPPVGSVSDLFESTKKA